MEYGHESHECGAVRHVVGGISPGGARAYAREGAADEVVDHGYTLGGDSQGCIREHDVVVDKSGAVAYFNEDVLAHHAASKSLCELGLLIIVEEVLADPRALGFPVGPDTHRAVVDMIPSHDDVDCRVELDA